MSLAGQFYRGERQVLNADYDGHNMVFVVGCPRSGTTWLQRLLSSHPRILTGQESQVFEVNIAPQLRDWKKMRNPQIRGGGIGLPCYLTEERFLQILKIYLLTLLEPMVEQLNPDELFLEKTPAHGLFLPEIFESLPGTRVIHLLRDARDVVSSLLAGGAWLTQWAPKSA